MYLWYCEECPQNAQYSVILNGLDCLGLACEVIAHIAIRLPEGQGRGIFSARIWRASTGASATPVWLALCFTSASGVHCATM
jgi:hypothetical protein